LGELEGIILEEEEEEEEKKMLLINLKMMCCCIFRCYMCGYMEVILSTKLIVWNSSSHHEF
jgi:hypothetical protein